MSDRLQEIRARLTEWGKWPHRGSVGGYMGPQSDGPPAPALPPVGVEVVNPFTGERIFRDAADD